MRKTVKYGVALLVLFLLAAQLVRPDRSNPVVNPSSTFEAIEAPSPEAITVMKRACYDCHSNATVWPWYSNIAPVSWLVADDVQEGRQHLNFSEWGLLSQEVAQKRLAAACKEIKGGDMPLLQYRLIHQDAKLSEQDIAAICGMTAKAR